MHGIAMLAAAGCTLAASAADPAASGAPAATDSGAGGEVAELRTMVADLQRQVNQLQAEKGEQWLTEQRAAEVRGLVQDVLADADTRASLLQSGAVAGWEAGRGFFLGSADGNYLLRLTGQVQFRAVYNRQEESPSDDNRFGFEERRVKVWFSGHVFDPSWQYEIEWLAARTGGVELGENGWIQKDLGNGWQIRAGQFKPLFTREESVSAKRLQNVERTLVNSQFTAGTVQGIQVRYLADQWRAFASFHDGVRTQNTPWSTEDTEYAFSGRAELLLMGDWKTVEDDIGFKGGEQGLMIGGGFSYERDEFGTGLGLPAPDFNNAEEDTLGLTADVTWKCGGGNIGAAVYYRMRDTDTGGAGDLDLDQYGFFIRGGLFVTEDIELFAQYEWGDLDIDAIEDLNVITVGVNKYWDKHNLKWQNDIGFGLDEVASAWAQDSAGWRGDASDEDGQIVVRSQFQLLF